MSVRIRHVYTLGCNTIIIMKTCDKCKFLYKETWEEKCWDTPAWCRHAKLPLREFNQKLNNKRLGDWGCTLWEYKNK